MYVHENVKDAFKKVTEMLKNKKTCKNGKVFFSLKDADVLSPMAVDVLLQLDMETIRSGKLKAKESK